MPKQKKDGVSSRDIIKNNGMIEIKDLGKVEDGDGLDIGSS